MQGGGSAPKFDAQQASQQQYGANVNTGVANAWLTNTNQQTPYGNLTYTQNGTRNVGGQEVPSFTATQTLSPEQQKIYDQSTALQNQALGTAGTVMGNVQNAVGTPLNYNGINALPTDQNALRDRAYGALTARGTEMIDRGEEAARTRLANQGVAPGTEAYARSMDQFNRARTDLSQQSEIGAGNIASQDLANAMNIRNQGITERTNLRDSPLMDYAKLMGFGGNVTPPQWAQGTQAQIPATDTIGPQIAAYQGQMNAWNQQQQSNNAMMGGLFGLGGSVLGAGVRSGLPFILGSDVRMKDNIRHVGHTNDGQRLYSFTYKNDPATLHIGLMAQEVEKVRPDAVVEIGGMKHVDYTKALADA